jgi:aspartate aminotransferase-like enzyme
MEMAAVNLLGPGRKGLCLNGGKFGERWGKICAACGLDHAVLDLEWGKAVRPEQVRQALEADPAITAVFATLCETSTGVLTGIRALGEVTRERDVLLIVDGISAAAGDEMRTDAWGVDVLVVGSQKALMLPPGIAVVTCSPRALEAAQSRGTRAFYFDMPRALAAARDGDSPFTPPVSMIVALNTALMMIEEEGIENVWARHAAIAAAARAAVTALALETFPDHPSNVVTVVRVPEQIDGEALRKRILAEHRVRMAGGQDQFKGRIIRMAHMGGSANEEHLMAGLEALERALSDLGHTAGPGAASAAAREQLAASL